MLKESSIVIMYNQQSNMVKKQEAQGNTFMKQFQNLSNIGSLQKNATTSNDLYVREDQEARAQAERIFQYLNDE